MDYYLFYNICCRRKSSGTVFGFMDTNQTTEKTPLLDGNPKTYSSYIPESDSGKSDVDIKVEGYNGELNIGSGEHGTCQERTEENLYSEVRRELDKIQGQENQNGYDTPKQVRRNQECTYQHIVISSQGLHFWENTYFPRNWTCQI